MLAAQLANFPDIRTVVIDRKDGPLEVGQADGVACRTVEMFEAFGMADRLIHEGYSVNEVSFWRPDSADRSKITRTGRIQDVEEGLSEMPHVIVNQARMLAYLLDHMERSPSRLRPHYGLHATDIQIDTSGVDRVPGDGHRGAPEGLPSRPVRSPRSGPSTSSAPTVPAAASATAIGRELVGDPMNQSWGVLDALVTTDFPDIRRKCAIHSANDGNILIIPREGGYLVRIYIELDNVRDGEMLENRSVTPEKLAEVANRILAPYTIDVKDVGWWAVYEIGQRLCRQVRRRPRGGDGQPAAAGVHRRRRLPHAQRQGRPGHERVHERHLEPGLEAGLRAAGTGQTGTAAHLLRRAAEDRQAAHRFRPRVRQDVQRPPHRGRRSRRRSRGGVDPEEFQQYFITQGRFTAGVATKYAPSMITAEPLFEHLAEGFPVGMRFHSAQVIRLADAKPVHLGHAARADGAWRLYVFADRNDPTDRDLPLPGVVRLPGVGRLPDHPLHPEGRRPRLGDRRPGHLPAGAPTTSSVDQLPSVLLPKKGKFGMTDYEKMFCPDPKAEDIFDLRGINRETGCIVVVRPDQYVAHVLPLHGHEALSDFFAGILIDAE